MALIIAGRVKESTTTTGIGDYTVDGAVDASYKAFSARCAVNDQFYGMVEAVDANGKPTGEWEEGLYTYSAANTITRSEIHDSSNAGAKVNWTAGTKHIFIAMTARQIRSLFTGSMLNNTGTGGGTGDTGTGGSGPTPVGPSAALYGPIHFQDEFSGTALNTLNWNDEIWYGDNDGEAHTQQNYSVTNGSLHIWPYQNPSGKWMRRTIDTDGKQYLKYGFYEARMKLNQGYGTWPAFWIFNHVGDQRPEIDIMEAYPGGSVRPGAPAGSNWGTTDSVSKPLNFAATAHRTLGSTIGQRKRIEEGLGNSDLSADYHVYGCHWDSEGIQFYFDGQPMGSKLLTGGALTTYDMYFMLDLWYGTTSGDGQTAGDPNAPPSGVNQPVKGIGNSFIIDYFRCWPLSGTTGGGTSTDIVLDYCGDSTIWGYQTNTGALVATTTPQKVASEIPTITVNNKGVNSSDSKHWLEGSGPVTLGWLDRMKQSASTHFIINHGINDASVARDEGTYKYYIDQAVQQAKANGKVIILQTPNPTTNLNMSNYATWMKAVATNRSVEVIDVYQWALDYMAANAMTQGQFTPDGIHPSDAMYIEIGIYAASRLKTILNIA